MLKRVVNDFRLFELKEDGGDVVVSSPYLNRVMKAFDEKHRRLAEAAAKRNNKFNRDENGRFTDNIGALDKIRLDKTISTTTVVDGVVPITGGDGVGDGVGDGERWERYLEEAVKDEVWMEVLAMNSGFSTMFVKHRGFVIEAFRRHVRLQGGGATVYSIGDIKAYAANFFRQGTITQKRMATLLAEREEELRRDSSNRYETIDPQTGERSYFGNRIPEEAPPRPNENAVWSAQLNLWL